MVSRALGILQELRTPLALVVGYIELAVEDEEGRARHCAIAERNVQLLRAAIETLEAELRSGGA